MGLFINMTGQKYSRLTVLKRSKKRGSRGEIMWLCQCDCGKKVTRTGASIRHQNTCSCGCLKNDHLRGINNPQARQKLAVLGEWLSCKDLWSRRAAGVWRRINKDGIETDFESVSELALFMRDNSPDMCPIFNEPLTNGKVVTHKWSPSLDRIDPNRGYMRDNVQVISMLANRMKTNATEEELVKFALWVLRIHGEKFGYIYKQT